MFRSRKLNSRISRLHKRGLRIVFQDCTSLFIELIKKNHSTTIEMRKTRLLAIELFKVKNGFLPPFMKEIQRKKQLNFQEIILKLCATDLKLGLF